MSTRMREAELARRWAGAERHLRARFERVVEEIRSYPAPIPACDAGFNHLLEQRRELPRAIAAARAGAERAAAGGATEAELEAFLAACPHLADFDPAA